MEKVDRKAVEDEKREMEKVDRKAVEDEKRVDRKAVGEDDSNGVGEDISNAVGEDINVNNEEQNTEINSSSENIAVSARELLGPDYSPHLWFFVPEKMKSEADLCGSMSKKPTISKSPDHEQNPGDSSTSKSPGA